MDEPVIPPKLQRYLMTIARRDGITQLRVAAVVRSRGKLGLVGRGLPYRNVNGEGIEAAVKELFSGLGLECSRVKYIGYVDVEGARQYDFELESDGVARELNLVELHDVKQVLPRKEARMILKAVGRA
ncbi:MAG: hypothetical protein AB1529_05220 [Candidatus Micrarchaeota archaeon]